MYSKKQAATKNQFETALLQLLAVKKFETITVRDVTEAMHYDRSSFYRYYDDKYALLGTIEDQVIADIQRHYRQVTDLNERAGVTVAQLTELLTVFDQPTMASRMAILLGPNGDRLFEVKLTKLFSTIFYESTEPTVKKTAGTALIEQYLANLFIQTIRYQTSPSRSLSTEELAQQLNDIYCRGFVTSLHRSHHEV
ncbi:TetR/AcrR family transcriptional regulator [Levilactobacillus spicheri]|nr:TetR/AcrR family transcriptional regulator [Levilactobacillus spicheri]GEO65719.1 TetR family transcriptional regulator [Levilactobacillus spicheri]